MEVQEAVLWFLTENRKRGNGGSPAGPDGAEVSRGSAGQEVLEEHFNIICCWFGSSIPSKFYLKAAGTVGGSVPVVCRRHTHTHTICSYVYYEVRAASIWSNRAEPEPEPGQICSTPHQSGAGPAGECAEVAGRSCLLHNEPAGGAVTRLSSGLDSSYEATNKNDNLMLISSFTFIQSLMRSKVTGVEFLP